MRFDTGTERKAFAVLFAKCAVKGCTKREQKDEDFNF